MNFNLIFIAVALVACGVVDGKSAMKQRFTQWASKYGFAHESPAMQERRFSIFKQNVEMIDAQNEKYLNGESTYFSDINSFTGLTEEERLKFTGFKTPEVDKKRSLTANQIKYSNTVYTAFQYSKSATAPVNTFKNWTSVWTFPPEQQGNCGSCWTFATTAVIDAAYKIKLGKDVTTSKEYLLECSKTFNNQCYGGSPLMAFDYVEANGIASQASYPYVSANLTNQPALCKTTADKTYAKVVKYFVVDKDEEAMRQAVDEYGPIAVGIDASSDFMNYKGGVYDGVCSSTSTNHAVVIVGYGTDSATGVPYWLVRNSWGSSANPTMVPYTINYVDSTGKIVKSVTTYTATWWGENGHFRIKRGVSKCGINLTPYGVTVQ